MSGGQGFCLLTAVLFSSETSILRKVIWYSRTKADSKDNLRILAKSFNRLGISKVIEWDGVGKDAARKKFRGPRGIKNFKERKFEG